jgi:hypothetical protein
MTALTRNPLNPNFLHPNKYQLNFGRMPNIQYFCQSVTVPGISMSEIPQATPFSDLYIPGDKPIFDLLNVTFLVDEEMKAWLEVYEWIRGMTFPTSFEEYQNLSKLNPDVLNGKPQYSNATITVLSSANNPIVRFHYYDVFPTSLSTVIMNASDSPENIITADATFRYSYFKVEQIA